MYHKETSVHIQVSTSDRQVNKELGWGHTVKRLVKEERIYTRYKNANNTTRKFITNTTGAAEYKLTPTGRSAC